MRLPSGCLGSALLYAPVVASGLTAKLLRNRHHVDAGTVYRSLSRGSLIWLKISSPEAEQLLIEIGAVSGPSPAVIAGTSLVALMQL